MRILFDHSTPYRLVRYLEGHSVSTAEECGWDRLTNGDLLATAENAGFDMLLTADENMRYQQNRAQAVAPQSSSLDVQKTAGAWNGRFWKQLNPEGKSMFCVRVLNGRRTGHRSCKRGQL